MPPPCVTQAARPGLRYLGCTNWAALLGCANRAAWPDELRCWWVEVSSLSSYFFSLWFDGFWVVVRVDLVGLMLRFVGCIWDFGSLRKESGRRTGSRSPDTWKYLHYKCCRCKSSLRDSNYRWTPREKSVNSDPIRTWKPTLKDSIYSLKLSLVDSRC